MYKNCREELLAVMRAFVIETGENEFSRAEAIAAIVNSSRNRTYRNNKNWYKNPLITLMFLQECR